MRRIAVILILAVMAAGPGSIGKDKGLVYGVVGLLKDYYGVDYWGEGEFFVAETPTFRYRQTQNYMMKSDSLWVHTCNHLLPADKYGKDLPEKRTGKVEFIPVEGRAESGPAKARYIKVEVTGTKTCPTQPLQFNLSVGIKLGF